MPKGRPPVLARIQELETLATQLSERVTILEERIAKLELIRASRIPLEEYSPAFDKWTLNGR